MNLIYQLKWKLIIPKLKKLKLIVFDVDGVLTDGGLWYDSKGELNKRFDVKDGLGIKIIQELGVEVVFLSGGKGGSTEKRAEQLNVQYCLVEVKDKFQALKNLQQKYFLPLWKLSRCSKKCKQDQDKFTELIKINQSHFN